MQQYFNIDICPVSGAGGRGDKGSIIEFYSKRKNFNFDAGLDLFCVEDQVIPGRNEDDDNLGVFISLGIRCRGYYLDDIKKIPNAYRLVPRSSIYKTPLRLSNSEGIIDQSYTGEIKAIVDNLSITPYHIKRGDRLFQIVAPTLVPIRSNIVDKLTMTDRCSCGYGSTGK